VLRRIIFIGQSGSDVIYYDTRNERIVKAHKSRLLDMERSRNNGRNAAIGAASLIVLGGSVGSFIVPLFSQGVVRLSYFLIGFLTVLWLIEMIVLILLLEQALYGPLRHKKKDELEPATKSEFRQAYMSNNIWCNPKGKKVTLGNKIGTLSLTIFMTAIAIFVLVMMATISASLFGEEITWFTGGEGFIGKPVNASIIPVSFLGVLPFAAYLLIFQNNAFRWLLVVQKYKDRKLKC
jgi:hypothetical protein